MTYPTIRPELTLDFANSRQLDPRITFSRTQTTGQATYLNPDTGLIAYASEHEARFEKEGLLVEESRTNLITQSENLSTTWFNGSATLDPAITDPVGNTGTVYYLTAGAERLTVWNGTGSSTVAVSVFIKQRAGEVSTHVIQVWQSGAFLGNVQCPLSGAFTPTGNYSNGVRTAYPNGWFKFSFTATGPGTFGTGCRLDTEQSTNYTWGYQIEEGSFPTSYIPTAGSTVTRSTDICTITGDNFSSWYSQGEGSFIVSADRVDSLPISQFTVLTTNGFRLPEFLFTNAGNGRVFNNLTGTYTTPAPLTSATFGGAFDSTGISRFINGAGDSVSSTSLNDTNTTLYLGNWLNNPTLYRLTGHISRLSYYSRRLSDSELQTITL